MAKRRSTKKTWIIITILAAVAIAAIAIFIGKKGPAEISVKIEEAQLRTITQTVSAIGKIQPETEVKISSETSGEIIYLGVNEGDTVKAGELLVRIKPDIVETQLEQMKSAADAAEMEINIRKAEMERTKKELERTTSLYEKEFISQQEFDSAQAAYQAAQAAYQAALSRYEQAKASFRQVKRSAERTTIHAPIDGIVTLLAVEKGEKVVGTEMMQGTEIMRVSDLSVMNAVVDVDENDIVMVTLGDTTLVEIDALGEAIYKGRVFEIGHSAKTDQLGSQDQVTNFEVKIRLLSEEPKLRPGMSCNVEIQTETRQNVVAVPLMAVTVRDTTIDRNPDLNMDAGRGTKKIDDDVKKMKDKPQPVVFIKDGNKARLVNVETGISDRGFIEIKNGLDEGQTVISGSFRAVSKQLYDGAPIQVDTTKFNRNVLATP
ncbi:MAG: efflux RND transporter periplasmic adaptor subunit [Candidatus Kapaibacterium sp.]